MTITNSIGHDRVIIGRHRNGETYARVVVSETGISATIEGTGCDKDTAKALLLRRLRQCEHEIGDIADHIAAAEDGAA